MMNHSDNYSLNLAEMRRRFLVESLVRGFFVAGLLVFALLVSGLFGTGLAQTTYTVLPGDTFSRIARAHDVSLTELQEANGGRREDLSPGDQIQIPTPVVLAPVILPGVSLASAIDLKHTVIAGETLYGISQRYGTAVSELERLNPAALNGLEIGDVLVIRAVPTDNGRASAPASSFVSLSDSIGGWPALRTDTLRALVMLPFMLESDTVKGGGYDAKTTRLRDISLEFLHGARWAAEMLRDSGYTVALKVVDTEPDSVGVHAWTDADLYWADVVLGPLRKAPLDSVNEKLRLSVIPQWVLTPQKPEVWHKHPWAFSLEAQPEVGMEQLGAFAALQHAGDTVLLLETRGAGASMEAAFRAGFEKAKADSTFLQSMPANAQFCEGLIAALDTSKLNIIAVPAGRSAQSLVAYVQTELQSADSFPVQLYGHPESRSFEFLERPFLERSHWTSPVSAQTLWSDVDVAKQVQTFRDLFQTDPSLYAFITCEALRETARWQGKPWPIPASVYQQTRWEWDGNLGRWMNRYWTIESFTNDGWFDSLNLED